MSVIAKNKVPDGGGENRHMFQLVLITHFLAVVKMKTHPLKDRIVTLQMRGVHIVATHKIVYLLLRVASVHVYACGVYVIAPVGVHACVSVCACTHTLLE